MCPGHDRTHAGHQRQSRKGHQQSRAYAGIGLRYGPVIAANLGSENHLSHSITGDTVNTAKRIESLAPAGQNTVLMSDAAYDQLGGAAVVSN
jgi:adenylate cyclase